MQVAQERNAVVIDDDADVRNLLVAILQQAGFTCVTASNGLDGIKAIREHQPTLTTLDVSMPGIDGLEVARRIRDFSTTYVIMLSARDEEIDTLMGLDAGADDYLTKPFRPRELRARLEAMLRRINQYGVSPGSPVAGVAAQPAPVIGVAAQPAPMTNVAAQPAPMTNVAAQPAPMTNVAAQSATVRLDTGRVLDAAPNLANDGWLRHNGLQIHPEMWLCELDSRSIELTRSEFDLLLALMEGERRVISKTDLALVLRGGRTGDYVSDADRRAVEVHMANLRRKLGDPVNSPRFIETVRGVGYRLTHSLRT